MRSGLLILCTIFYFVTTTGVFFSVHRCGGKIVSVTFFSGNSESCGSTGCKEKGCCENESHFIKVKDDQTYCVDLHLPDFNSALIFENGFYFQFEEYIAKTQTTVNTIIKPPPLINQKTPLYIKKQVFLI